MAMAMEEMEDFLGRLHTGQLDEAYLRLPHVLTLFPPGLVRDGEAHDAVGCWDLLSLDETRRQTCFTSCFIQVAE